MKSIEIYELRQEFIPGANYDQPYELQWRSLHRSLSGAVKRLYEVADEEGVWKWHFGGAASLPSRRTILRTLATLDDIIAEGGVSDGVVRWSFSKDINGSYLRFAIERLLCE